MIFPREYYINLNNSSLFAYETIPLFCYSAPHNEIQAEQSAVVEAKNLTPEQSEAIEEYLKTVEQTLRDDGGFDEATIQQALEIKRAEEEKKFLEQ